MNACCPLLTHSPFQSFKEQSRVIFQKEPPLCCLVTSIIPPFQALLSRGMTELLLTSDSKDGLNLGGVKGGIVR